MPRLYNKTIFRAAEETRSLLVNLLSSGLWDFYKIYSRKNQKKTQDAHFSQHPTTLFYTPPSQNFSAPNNEKPELAEQDNNEVRNNY